MILSEEIAQAIKMFTGNLHAVKPVSGGSINQSYQITTDKGICFLKTNSARQFPDLFLSEAEGLRHIRETNTIAVPDVMGHGKAGEELFLILSWINSAKGDDSQYLFGQQLAKMHTHTAGRFGLEHDNYIGSLPQKNQWNASWHEFFANERLEPKLKLSYDKKLISRKVRIEFDAVLTKLQALYPQENPSLVHGDLWCGNYIIGSAGTPFLIDPAVYYGNREVDLAMSSLFGGFSPEFYRGYHDEFPLQAGWRERLDLWNLYPLLVHLNLFGSGYVRQITDILKKFA